LLILFKNEIMKKLSILLFFSIYIIQLNSQEFKLLKDINPGNKSAVTNRTPAFLSNGNFLFVAKNEKSGPELWVTDGTPKGTMMVKEINPNRVNGPSNLCACGDYVYFNVYTEKYGSEIFKSDGTKKNTVMITNEPNEQTLINITDYYCSSKGLFFTTYLPYDPDKLWISDGTKQGTKFIHEFDPGNLTEYCEVQGKVYFSIEHKDHGTELWATDGSTQGTVLVKDIAEGKESSKPKNLSLVDDKLLFSVGNELWASDGTTGGTKLIATFDEKVDYISKAISSNGSFVVVGRKQLWLTKGGSDNTILLKNMEVPVGLQTAAMRRNKGGTIGLHFRQIGNDFYFIGGDVQHGYELWKANVDGSINMIEDYTEGTDSSFDPIYTSKNWVEYKGRLVFTGTSGMGKIRNDGLLECDGNSIKALFKVEDFVGERGSITSLHVNDDYIFLSLRTISLGSEYWVYSY
jgi:ELWxxDGT repeat protein